MLRSPIVGLLLLVCCPTGVGAQPGRLPPAQAADTAVANGANSADKTEEAAAPPKAFNLFDTLFSGTCLHNHGVRLNGFIDQGFTFNPANPPDGFNGPVACNDRANEYLLDEVYLSLSRAIDPSKRLLDWGFSLDVLFGSDAFFFSTYGLDDTWLDGNRFYRASLPQFYAELFIPHGYQGLTIKAGHYYGIMGYELQLAPDHFFYSYGLLSFYAIPFQHTGVHLTYPLSERVVLTGGVNRGWQNFRDNNNALSGMGSASWTSRSKKTQLYFALISGPEQDEGVNDSSGVVGLPGESLNRLQYTVWLKHKLTERLEYVIHHDAGFQDLSRTDPEASAEWYGISQYLYLKLAEKLSLGLRGEWIRDDDGTRVLGFRSGNFAAPGNYFDLTLALNYRPCANLIIKPELRWDWQHRDDPSLPGAYNAGRSTSQFLAALEVVLKF